MKTQSLPRNLIEIVLMGLLVPGLAIGQHWDDDGNDIYNTNSGNVGIGTGSPDAKLDIATGGLNVGNVGTNATAGDIAVADELRIGINDATYLFLNQNMINAAPSGSDLILNGPGGNVGIGTTNPIDELYVHSTTQNPGIALSATSTYHGDILFYSQGTLAGLLRFFNDGSLAYMDRYPSAVTRFYIDPSGDVGIGTTTIPSGYKLAVDGKIIAEEVEVEMSGSWPDHVFEKNYNLKPLNEVEAYIHANQHLPGLPSASDVAENGVSLGEMQARLLLKVEELTLYVIDLKKENEALEARVAELEQ